MNFVLRSITLSLLVSVLILILLSWKEIELFLLQSSRIPIALSGGDPSIVVDYVRIIPKPHSMHLDRGKIPLTDHFGIISNRPIVSNDLRSAVQRYTRYVSLVGKVSTKPLSQHSRRSSNELLLDCSSLKSDQTDSYPQMGENEAYELIINDNGSSLASTSVTGFIRGLATFVQLIEYNASSNQSVLPHITILDQPRFVWRGLMIDVSRHWMPVKVIKRTMDAMEMSKMNVLHLHLSDDQGFRVQSERYPLLHDRVNYYTSKDIRRLVEYAKQRRIRIVPEFDIPGHTTSWFVGYPELASDVKQYRLETRWGAMPATMDPTHEKTYTFLDGFFDEMTKLFPDRYFHIGGDEVDGSEWQSSPSIHHFMRQKNLENQRDLQAYFNKRVEKLLEKYQKTLIGWEEIVAYAQERFQPRKNTTIQVWKSPESIIDGIEQGYQIIRSQGYYLDSLSPASAHYRVDPVSEKNIASVNGEVTKRILGGEACMWTEYVSNETIDSRLWPRVLAIAERLWSPWSVNNEYSMYQRLFRMGVLLDEIQIGLTHRSSYRSQLGALIIDPTKRDEFLHPLMILADVCEPLGSAHRLNMGRYSARVPLTTFNDALRPESEFVWKLRTMPINHRSFHDVFRMWSTNHLRLQNLFEAKEKAQHQRLWVQEVEQLSINLAKVGDIGLRVLHYMTTGQLHPDPNHAMNQWLRIQWILHHKHALMFLEMQVSEIRLAAVAPVLRLLTSIE